MLKEGFEVFKQVFWSVILLFGDAKNDLPLLSQ